MIGDVEEYANNVGCVGCDRSCRLRHEDLKALFGRFYDNTNCCVHCRKWRRLARNNVNVKFKVSDGRCFVERLNPYTTTVEDLKTRLPGYVLLFQGRNLETASDTLFQQRVGTRSNHYAPIILLSDLGLAGDPEIVLLQPKQLEIRILTMNGDTLTLPCCSNADTVWDVKYKIFIATSTRFTQQKLIHQNQVLDDHNLVIGSLETSALCRWTWPTRARSSTPTRRWTHNSSTSAAG